MAFEIIIERPAHESIERKAVWWAQHHSTKEALEWQELIYRQISELATMPGRHGLAHENSEFPFELRQKLVGKGKRPTYRVLFTIRESAVHVLEFLAAEQDDWSKRTY